MRTQIPAPLLDLGQNGVGRGGRSLHFKYIGLGGVHAARLRPGGRESTQPSGNSGHGKVRFPQGHRSPSTMVLPLSLCSSLHCLPSLLSTMGRARTTVGAIN